MVNLHFLNFLLHSKVFILYFQILLKEKNWVLVSNSNFRNPISLQPHGVNLWYFKLRIFGMPKFIIWNIKVFEFLPKTNIALRVKDLKNESIERIRDKKNKVKDLRKGWKEWERRIWIDRKKEREEWTGFEEWKRKLRSFGRIWERNVKD